MGWLQAAPRFGGAFVFVLCYTERMNLYDSVLASLPSNVFKLNSAGTAFVDALNRGTTLTGTQALTNSIVTGNAKSIQAKNSNALNFVTPAYNAGRADSSFSLEAWFRPQYFTTSAISILSHNNEYDGLWADADNIYFTVKFGTNTASVSWPIPDAASTYHVVGIYSNSKISLYINADVVSELDVSDYISQNFKSFASNNLYIGQSATAGQMATVDGIAVYTRGLSDAEIYRHFAAGRRVFSIGEIALTFGGTTYDSTARDFHPPKKWVNREDWATGSSYTDVDFSTGNLRPTVDLDTGLSRTGTWTSQYELSGASNVYGVIFDWDSDGSFTVEASKDLGTTWIPVTNGRVIAGTVSWVPGDFNLLIRVTFTGGLSNDVSVIRSLRARGYATSTVYGSYSTRTITVGSGVSTSAEQSQPIEGKIGSGFTTVAGAITINPDTDASDPKPVQTVEMWHKFDTAPANKFVFDTRSGGTAYLWVNASGQLAYAGMSAVYVNGVSVASGSFVPLAGVWYHFVAVMSSTLTTKIEMAATDRSVSVLNVYPTALTAADAALMYQMYSDYPFALLATDSSPVTEGVSAYTLYGYDWSIAPTG